MESCEELWREDGNAPVGGWGEEWLYSAQICFLLFKEGWREARGGFGAPPAPYGTLLKRGGDNSITMPAASPSSKTTRNPPTTPRAQKTRLRVSAHAARARRCAPSGRASDLPVMISPGRGARRGLTSVRELRHGPLPILFSRARLGLRRGLGLRLGADDYLTKE